MRPDSRRFGDRDGASAGRRMLGYFGSSWVSGLQHDLKAVCSGVAAEGEAAYGTGEAPYGLYAVIGDDPDYNFIALSGIPDEWHYNEPDRQIQLVLCLDRIGAVHEVFCPYESQGTEWTVEAFSVNYQATLREAKTAAVIDSDTFYAKSDGCPFVSVFVDGQPDPKPNYASPAHGIDTFLAPYVLP